MPLQSPIYFGSRYDEKLALLKKAGLPSIRIVSDYDRTLTPAVRNGEPVATSFNILSRSRLLSPAFESRVRALFNTYRPLEVDQTLDKLVRFEKMLEWWKYSLEAVVDERINRETLTRVAQSKYLKHREGTEELLQLSAQYEIPFFIFSAGVGNIIDEHLVHHGLLHEMVSVFANRIEFNEADEAIGYKLPVIHSENKNETTILQYGLATEHPQRSNVILLGDQLGDATMTDESNTKTVLKIGLLNENADTFLPQFQQTFDVVITGDGNLDFVNRLLKELE